MINAPWSEADVAKLRELAAKGMTSREIAKELGEGYTRNSVIGKTQRMGIWLGKFQPPEPEPVVEPAPSPTATIHHLKPKTVVRRPPNEPPKPVGNQAFLMALTSNMCRFPVNESGANTLFCGDPTENGSWCPEHRKRVFYPKPGVKRDGEEVELRKKSDGFLPDSGASSFRFGAKIK
jgi:GcrA cell cycle regulator